MTVSSVRLSRAAAKDVAGVIESYATEGGEAPARAFRDAIKDAFELLSRFPLAGSGRIGASTSRPDVRTWPVTGFPYVVVYREAADALLILRLLHTRRDLPASLR